MMSSIKKYFLFVTLFCSSVLLPNYSVTPYSYEFENDFLQNTVQNNGFSSYAAYFDKDGTEVFYLATTSIDLDLFIKNLFADYEPDVIVVQNERLKGSFEGKQILVSGLSERRLFELGVEKGYTERDIFYNFCTQKVWSWCFEGRVKSLDDIRSVFQDEIGMMAEFCGVTYTLTGEEAADDYMCWLEDCVGEVDFSTFETQDLYAPLADGTLLQRISYDETLLEDQHILSVIDQARTSHKKIVVIGARSRFATQYVELVEMFGEALFITDPSEL